jgi:hypothetical protein
MKKSIALILVVISSFITSCTTSPHLAGNWQMGGPYNVGKPCRIAQTGKDLIFVNENSGESSGVLKSESEVIALNWEGGLSGILTNNATRINWRNGTWWIREK